MADHASTALGPKLGQLIYCDIGGGVPNALRRLLRAYDQLIQGSVKSTALIAPPGSPANGDAYIILQGTTPTGAWAGQAGKVAVYSTQIATVDTNTKVPGWEFYTPKAGWGFWSEAENAYYHWIGGAWALRDADLATLTAMAGMSGGSPCSVAINPDGSITETYVSGLVVTTTFPGPNKVLRTFSGLFAGTILTTINPDGSITEA